MTSRKYGPWFYEIINNPDLLRQMTSEEGQDLSYTEQVMKLEKMMEESRRGLRKKHPNIPPPDVLDGKSDQAE